MNKKRKEKPNLSDKIAEALTVKPRADIEDDHVFGTKPQTVTRADFSSSDSEDEAAVSDFRKRNVNLLSDLSKKYEGEVVSKKRSLKISTPESDAEKSDDALNGVSDSENLASNDEDDKSESKFITSKDLDEDSDVEESDDYSITNKSSHLAPGDSASDDDEGSGDENDYDLSQMEEPIKETFEHVKKLNVSEDVKKGRSVRSQLLLWEGLLEMRIHLQRCLNTANQMPEPEVFSMIKDKGREDIIAASHAATTSVSCVLDKLLNLQTLLLQKYPETKNASCGKLSKQSSERPTDSDEEIPSDTEDEEIPSDTDPEDESVVNKQNTSTHKKNKENGPPAKKRKTIEYETDIAKTHKALIPFRNATIQKWNEKTRLATVSGLKNTPTNSILSQINFILLDKAKLIRRTQLKRSEYDIVGHKKEEVITEDAENVSSEINPVTRDRKHNDEYIPEIFDDSDFYHQILRELIECKSADISDPVQLSRQWIALQQMRSKMKRKVDTKATKGRRIKYVVHNKLVNFMAPEKDARWTDESKSELYSSLFGKMFENNAIITTKNQNGLKKKQ